MNNRDQTVKQQKTLPSLALTSKSSYPLVHVTHILMCVRQTQAHRDMLGLRWTSDAVHKWPTHSPPLTPTLGCSLADKMTSTIPMINHSFRILARRPMFQPGVHRITPPAPPSHHPDPSLTTLQLLLQGFSVRKHKQSNRSFFRTHGPQHDRKDWRRGPAEFFFFYRNTVKSKL